MLKIKIIAILTLILTGCGGGGGGSSSNGGGGTIPTVAFTSWSAVQPNTEIVAPAISTETTYTENLSETITSVGNFTTFSGIEFRETFGADGTVTKGSLTTGDGDRLVFDKAAGATFTPIVNGFATVAFNANETAFAIVVEPIPQGWNYQTFGVWQRSPSQGNPGRVGAISTGSFTAANNIPSTGSATFTGVSAGVYLPSVGSYSGLVAADMRMNVNFSSRTSTFGTTNTSLSTNGGQSFTSVSFLNLTGNLQITGGQNLMSGTVTTASNLSGDIYGKFYGPSAQEVGGTFGLKGSGVETYVGGFGGKR